MLHQDEVRPMSGVQGWFNGLKSHRVTYHVYKLKERTYDNLSRQPPPKK